MGNETFLPVERRVLEGAIDGKTERLSDSEFQQLINGKHYRPSLGSPAHAAHYRRAMDDGTCLHLVVERDVCWLHCDRFDPHRDPLSLLSHLATEAPRATLGTAATVWSIVRIITR